MTDNSRRSDLRLSRRVLLHAVPLALAGGWLPALARAAGGVLHLYNWDDYMSEDALASFETKSGAQIKLDFFADGEEQFAKLKLGNSGYDVTFPTHDSVTRMWQNGLLLPLDHHRLPNLVNLAAEHQNPSYDPGNRHSVPYMWGTIGIAYRKSAVAPPVSWRDILTREGIGRNGRVAWISEAISMVPVASLMIGNSANDLSDGNLRQVFAELTPAFSQVTKVAEDNGQDLLAAGEVDMAIEWNGDIAQLIAEDDDIGFVIPQEGSIYYVDCMCILADTAAPELAHDFINHVLDAQVGKEIAEYIGYATPNARAYDLSTAEYRNNPVTFPPAATKLETVNYPGEDRLRKLFAQWEQMIAG